MKPFVMSMLICLSCLSTALGAGTYTMELDRTEAYVGGTIQAQITIRDASQWDPPEIPAIPGLDIERRSGGTSSSIRIFNGIRTEQTQISYVFLITASSPGTYSLPSFPIEIDGSTYETAPRTLIFRRSPNAGLLRAEVFGDPDEIYQGETTTLTLQIMVRQFIDDRLRGGGLDEGDTWNQIRPDSDWGPFTEAIRDLEQSGRRPRGRLQTLQSDTGGRERYWRYNVQADVRPAGTGPLDVSDIVIVMDYPLSLRTQRGFFNTGLQIGASRPVTTVATCRDVDVLPLPEADRPPLFNGAVGTFDIDTTASPTEVAVGDPITLVVTLSDRSSGPGGLDVLPAPELDRVTALEEEFRVPRESLAGVVSGRTKRFTQTIRARSDEVTSIPAIPFVFFDPSTRRYETVESTPIPISVTPTRTITSADVRGEDRIPGTSEDLGDVAGGLLANTTGPDALLSIQQAPGWGLVLAIVAGPPVLAIGLGVLRPLTRRRHGEPHRRRARRAGRLARQALAAVADVPESERGATIIAAVCTYVADRLGVPSAGFMRGDAVASLERREVPQDLVERFDAILTEAEQLQYARSDRRTTASLIASAEDLVEELDRMDAFARTGRMPES